MVLSEKALSFRFPCSLYAHNILRGNLSQLNFMCKLYKEFKLVYVSSPKCQNLNLFLNYLDGQLQNSAMTSVKKL